MSCAMESRAPVSDLDNNLPLSPEAQCIASNSLALRKKLGQFFTPVAYANIMADWIAAASPESVLDPAIGTGVLIDICQKRKIGRKFTGYDIDSTALGLARHRLATTELHHQDFLSSDYSEQFDAIVANPPYIMHRDYDLDPHIADFITNRAGQKLSRQSNLYIYFVIKICEQLTKGGRAAILIPAEWMFANYGQPLKAYLLDQGLLHGLVTMDLAGHAFADNMATASILMIEKGGTQSQVVESVYVPDGTNLTSLDQIKQDPAVICRSLPNTELRLHKKWDMLLGRSAKPCAKGSIKLGELVTTKRGIATGANRFFLLSQGMAEQQGLDIARMDRCVGKTAQVTGICFADADFERAAGAGQTCFLFNPKGNCTPAEAAYIMLGENIGISRKHGPRTKKIWYAAEAREPAPIWASVFGRGRMRFVHNAAGVKTLTCFHGLYPKDLDAIQTRALVAVLNSGAMQTSIAAHVRRFASGLMKLEPRDILDIPVPDIRLVHKETVARLAHWLDESPPDGGARDEAMLDQLAYSLYQSFDGRPRA